MTSALTHFHYLHQYPELSGQEAETSKYVRTQLAAMGYAPREIGRYGVYADHISDPDAPWILFRADMDALPVCEPESHTWCSKHSGVMHACGHDSHTSMLLAAAEALKDEVLPQNIRFLWQPAEETTSGATGMVENGIMPPHAIAAFAFHVWPQVPLGKLAVRREAMMASADVFLITCTGRAAHCGQRHKGADALLAAVAIADAIPEIEALAENDGTMLFCGSLHAGAAHNVVADKATLYGTLRSFSEPHRQAIIAALTERAPQIGAKFGVQVQVEWNDPCPVLWNDPQLVDGLQTLFPDLNDQAEPTLIAEDFSCYQQLCPGVLLWLGAGDTAPLHSRDYIVPDEVLPMGVENWIKIARTDWQK